ncbi:MAG: hypothetical protein SNJ55_06105 [Chloroherpetonaceae bacterium]
MKLLFRKKPHYQVVCVRPDGTTTAAKVGAQVAYHDLAHVVVELKGGFENGFFGLVAKGESLSTLSDPSMVKNLGRESLVVEVLVRALGAMLMGACTPSEYDALVREELGDLYAEFHLNFSEADARAWLSTYESLLAKWELLGEEGTLVIDFNPTRIEELIAESVIVL